MLSTLVFVLNVIENPDERAQTLTPRVVRSAGQVLVVSAQMVLASEGQKIPWIL